MLSKEKKIGRGIRACEIEGGIETFGEAVKGEDGVGGLWGLGDVGFGGVDGV